MPEVTYPPGPSLPSFLQLKELLGRPFRFLDQCRRAHGDVFTIRLLGSPPVVFVADPDAVKQIMSSGYDTLMRMANEVRFLIGERSVIFLHDEPHHRTRRLMMPPFHGDRMREYGQEMVRIADEIIGQWHAGPLALAPEVQQIGLNVILRCVFGVRDGARFTRLRTLLLQYIDGMMTPWMFGAGMLLSGARVHRFLDRRAERARMASPDAPFAPSRIPLQSLADRMGAIDAILFAEIDQCRREGSAGRTDILAMLVDARDEDGQPLSREELRDHLFTLVVGGHETTATSLCWAVHCLLRAPDALARVRAEQQEVFGGEFHPERARELKYLDAVIHEAMRLYPISFSIGRKLRQDIVICGYSLPAGTTVAPCMYLIHRHPSLWEAPYTFHPEHFLSRKPPPHQYFPFGGGAWRCLGAAFAEYEMLVVLARILSRVQLEADWRFDVHPAQRGFTIAPSHGMPVKIHSIRPAPSLHPPEQAVAMG